MAKLVIALVIFVTFSGAALAGADDDAEQCRSFNVEAAIYGDAAISGDAVIQFCTKAISSGELSAEDLAISYAKRGSAYNIKGNLDRALADFNSAIKLKPFLVEALLYRGGVYFSQGKKHLAFSDISQGLRLEPDNVEGLIARGALFMFDGNFDMAMSDFNEAIRLKPDEPQAFLNRGTVFLMRGDSDRAFANFNMAIELKPDFAEAYRNRGSAYARLSQYDRAIADFDTALRLNPDYTQIYVDKASLLNHMAWIRATSSNADERDGEEAVRLALESIAIFNRAETRDTLAAAYAEAGRFEDAVMEQERVIEMMRAAGMNDDIADARNRLKLYRRGQPFRK